MREMLNPTSAIAGMGLGSSVALITSGRFSGTVRRSIGGEPEQQWEVLSLWWRKETESASIFRKVIWNFWFQRRRIGEKKSGMAAKRAESNYGISGKICGDGYQRQQGSYS